MRYCERCIIPDTRPGIEIGPDGVCSACKAHGESRAETDWDARAEQFAELVERVRGLNRRWDCVVPVSGGKDSTWQALKCLELGLHPLTVTWKTPVRTELGQRNLDNLVELGVDHVDFRINPRVERKLMHEALARYGSPAIPMHLAIFNIPLNVATRFDVPLVVWGENSAAEYIGHGPESTSFRLDSEWVRKYGAVEGTTAADWVSDELSERDLAALFGPSEQELADKQVEAVFLGYFFEWDPEQTARVAREHGFEAGETPKTGYYAFADVDDKFIITIHHWLKWHKFGFTRTYDNLSLEIRNGRMTRDEAIEALRARGDETPHAEIEACADYLGITAGELHELAERFRNPEVWSRRDDVWVIEDFLIPDWDWTEAATPA